MSNRKAHDQYFTPQPLADAIVAKLAETIQRPQRVLEPSAGAGVFVISARRSWQYPEPRITSEEIDESLWPSLRAAGTHDIRAGHGTDHGFDLVLGNPPYLQAEKFVRDSCARLAHRGHLAFLLRLSFLASVKRASLYREMPLRYLIPIAGRPSFTGDGKTDSSEYACFVWQRGHAGSGEVLAPLEWR